MAKEQGTNVLLAISDGTSPITHVNLGGQQNTEFVGSSETDDITDKSQLGWGSTGTTLNRGTVNVQGKTDWADPLIDYMRQQWEARTPIDAKIILNAAGGNYQGQWWITDFQPASGTHLNFTEYSFTLQNEGALTWSAS